MALIIRRNALCSLMEENKQLRRLCANIAGFVGNQMTNALANTGMAQVDFDAVVSRGETDTMHASFARSAEQYNMTPLEVIFDQTPPTTANTKPSSIDGSGRLSPSTKRKRESEGTLAALPDARHNPASANRPDRSTSASVPPSPFAHSAYPPMHAPFPPHFQPRPSEPAYYAYGLPSPADMASYYSRPDAYTGANGDVAVTTNGAVTQGFAHPAYAPAAFYDGKLPLPANGRNPRETAQPQNGFVGEANPPAGSFEHMLQQELGASAPPLLMQAVQLIGYHLSNRRANSTYPLPTSLLPTSMQASIPHSAFLHFHFVRGLD